MFGLGLSISSEDSSTNGITLLVSALGARLADDGGTIENPSCMQQDLADLVAEATPFTTGLLEFYPNAAAAYSLRQLRRSVFPYAIRVRRSGDSLEQDIGFNSNGELDTNALLDFADGGDAFVSVWYDQSSNGNDATQGTDDYQPQIVSSGSLITENGKPAIQGDGTNGKHLTTSNTTLSGDLAVVAVCAFNTSKLNAMIFGGTQPASRSYLWRQTTTTLNWKNDSENGFNYFTVSLLAANNLIFGNRAGTDVSMSVNGSNNTLTESATQGLDFTINRIGGGFSDGYSLDGTYQEMIFYNSDQSANRTGIESNINDFYSIYP